MKHNANKPKVAQPVVNPVVKQSPEARSAEEKLAEVGKRLAEAEKKLAETERKRDSAEQEWQRLRDDCESLDQKMKTLKESFDKRKGELEENFSDRKKEIDEQISVRKAELDELISDRKETIKLINDEGARLVSDIKSALSEMRESAGKNGERFGELYVSAIGDAEELMNRVNEDGIRIASALKSALEEVRESAGKCGAGFGELYAAAADAARERLVSAVSETDKVIASLAKLNDEISEKSGEYVEESVNRRREAEKELSEWRESKFAEVDGEIKKAREENEAKKVLLDRREEELVLMKRTLEGRESALSAYIEEKVGERVGLVVSDNEGLKRQIDDLYAELENANKEKAVFEHEWKKSEAFDINQLKDENRDILEKLMKMQDERIPEELRADIIAKAKQYEGLKNELTEAQERLYEFERENIRLKRLEGLNSFLKDLTDEQAEKIEELKDRVNQLKDAKLSQGYRMEPITKRVFTGKYPKLNEDGKEISEREWLDKIKDGIRDEGFEFSDRLVEAFHTCVKTAIWSPITVLAGVSGTGKSELPRLYSQYGGLLFVNTPVKPDWDSPSSMLGYYNALERRFEAKPILRAMCQMQEKDGGFLKKGALFLLDEMNLAHIELYFSDMLSKLEENRNKEGDGAAQIDIDLGAGVDSLPIKLTRNMLWVGTMNEDETTKGLSDKVVDRSNIIVFPRPKALASRSLRPKAGETYPLLDWTIWERWQNEYLKLREESEFRKVTEKYRKIIESISECLEKGGRALGHRVWQSIEHYIAACPRVADACRGKIDSEENEKKMDGAFAEAVAFKVMPKLRGIETEGKVKEDCLNAIKDIIGKEVPDLSADYENANNAPYGVFMWKSGGFLEAERDENDDKPEDGGSKKRKC